MTAAKMAALSPVELGILRRLSQGPATGSEVQRDIGADADTYLAASVRLWNGMHLRGQPSDGCCNDPCGPACVSAFKQDRVWMLTVYGEAALHGRQRRVKSERQ